MAKGNLVSRILEKGKKVGLPLAASAAIGLGALLFGSEKANAATTYQVYPADSVTTINNVITDANSGDANSLDRDTVYFNTGTYFVPDQHPINLKPNRNYTFDSAIMDGDAPGYPQGTEIFMVAGGGDFNFTGTSTIQNVNNGFILSLIHI